MAVRIISKRWPFGGHGEERGINEANGATGCVRDEAAHSRLVTSDSFGAQSEGSDNGEMD